MGRDRVDFLKKNIEKSVCMLVFRPKTPILKIFKTEGNALRKTGGLGKCLAQNDWRCKMAQSNEVLAKSGKSHLSKEEKENLIKNTVKIESEKDKIIAPSYLTDEMKDKFYFLADELATIKIFTHLDVDSLAQYVFNLAKFEEASKLLNNLNMLDENYEKISKEQEKKFKMVKTGANELGLNILTRSKLIVPVKEKKKNKFDRFQ